MTQLSVVSRTTSTRSRPRREVLSTLLVLGFLIPLGCADRGDVDRASVQSAKPLNVVLVLIDTLRADHMSLYGYKRDTTPKLVELASRGAVFEQARSQAACTFPSANVILTSRPMSEFLGRSDESEGGRMGIPPQIPSIAQIFQAAGYDTVAVSASPIVRKSPGQHNPGGGFGGGFRVFDETCTWMTSDCVLQRANSLLPTAEPRFLYLHLMEPHGPYEPQDVYFSSRYEGTKAWVAEGKPNPIVKQIHGSGEIAEWNAADLQHFVDLYDDEIRSLDARLAPYLEQILSHGDTLVALVADHGESFLEKDSIGHCERVWDSETRVPFVLLGPGAVPQRFSNPVETIDLMPTLLELAGVAVPDSLYGRSLVPLLDGAPAEPGKTSFSRAGRWRGLVWDHYKLVTSGDPNNNDFEPVVFDLSADPEELHDISEREPKLTERLQSMLKSRFQLDNGNKTPAQTDEELEESIEQLRALGYLD